MMLASGRVDEVDLAPDVGRGEPPAGGAEDEVVAQCGFRGRHGGAAPIGDGEELDGFWLVVVENEPGHLGQDIVTGRSEDGSEGKAVE
jgi:hypothetical protein